MSRRPPSRRQVVRHLLHPRNLRGSLTLSPQPSLRNAALAGLQAAVAAAIALPLTLVSPWPHLIGFVALGVLVALFGRFAPPRSRNPILLQCALWQSLAVFGMSMAVWLGASAAGQLALLAFACGFFFLVCVTGRFGAPGPLIFVFAVGASMADSLTLAQVLERTAATTAAAAFSWAVCAASEALRHPPRPGRPFPAEPARPLPHRLMAAARITAGTALAAYASHALGANHPAWAAMGTLAVMQGTHLHISMNRALQRMAGTVAGALLAWAFLIQNPTAGAVIAALVLLQFVTEVVIGANYGLGQVLVTPMALLMTHLAAPHAAGPAMAPERVLDTLLGATIGICLAVVLSSLDDRRHLAGQRDAQP
ncbi:FUSC family protein [Paracoccus sp. MC1854]|uniref:FUSC family protein n=1 Tax=Paracoccus sp. MC1854 TaxID=2760306 RepID=UPI0016023233|nr:FUSC family protein [Paracoccus sp. MC1854]MBB1492472.1 FUSC family protein [Paracoccus sp. MC1854]